MASTSPNTRRSLAVAEWTRQHQPSAFPQLHRKLFAAHFALAEDIEDSAVIDRYATESGIDVAPLHAALSDGSAESAVKEAEMIGRKYSVLGTTGLVVRSTINHGTSSSCGI